MSSVGLTSRHVRIDRYASENISVGIYFVSEYICRSVSQWRYCRSVRNRKISVDLHRDATRRSGCIGYVCRSACIATHRSVCVRKISGRFTSRCAVLVGLTSCDRLDTSLHGDTSVGLHSDISAGVRRGTALYRSVYISESLNVTRITYLSSVIGRLFTPIAQQVTPPHLTSSRTRNRTSLRTFLL